VQVTTSTTRPPSTHTQFSLEWFQDNVVKPYLSD